MKITPRQKDLMYLLKAEPVNIHRVHTATLASLLHRNWAIIEGNTVHPTRHGIDAFQWQVKRDYNAWLATLKDTAKRKRESE